MSLQEQSNRFLKQIIRNYYAKRPLKEPPLLSMREVAVQPFGSKSYIRHLHFTSMSKLYDYIIENPPLHLYYSAATYDDPGNPDMESKGFRGADVLFDIDADHYPECSHSVLICSKCGYVWINGGAECPRCGSRSLASLPQLSIECLKKAWRDSRTIVRILEEDFGASKISTMFSGNRGFHIRVEDKHLLSLDRDSRRMLVDYIQLSSLDPGRVFPKVKLEKRGGYVALFHREHECGLRARIRDYLKSVETPIVIGDYEAYSYDNVINAINALKIGIDPAVTMDVSRLSRFSNSINGKSGLLSKPIDVSDEFNYSFYDFRAVSGEVLIKPAYDLTGVTVLDRKVNLRRGFIEKVEAYIGFYLALKGLAYLVRASRVEVLTSEH
ncbi:MAG: DNA primase small subunit domain-containing protein [Desulfurococcaceae archaeon]